LVPIHTNSGGVHKLEWEGDSRIETRMERLYSDSHHVVHGEITVRAYGMHIHQARMNLTSTRSRVEVANACGKRAEGAEYDWTAIIEQTCVLILLKHRQGDPAIDLSTAETEPGDRFLIDPVLPKGHPTTIYGMGGSGKSLFALYLSVLVAAGASTDRLIAAPGNVLYLDWEADRQETLRRYHEMCVGLDIDPPPLTYRFSYRAIADEVDMVQRLVSDAQIGLVIIDSAAPACGGKPELAENAIQFFTALRSLHTTSLIVAHADKATGGQRGPFGSVFWTNLSRSVWQVKKSQRMGASALDFSIWHRKTNLGKLMRPIAYRVEFANGATTFNDIRVKDSEELSRDLPLPERIANLLAKGPLPASEIASELDASAHTVSVTLSRKKNLFTLLGGVRWGLLHNEG
jgi:hypothetical protein